MERRVHIKYKERGDMYVTFDAGADGVNFRRQRKVVVEVAVQRDWRSIHGGVQRLYIGRAEGRGAFRRGGEDDAGRSTETERGPKM